VLAAFLEAQKELPQVQALAQIEGSLNRR